MVGKDTQLTKQNKTKQKPHHIWSFDAFTLADIDGRISAYIAVLITIAEGIQIVSDFRGLEQTCTSR